VQRKSFHPTWHNMKVVLADTGQEPALFFVCRLTSTGTCIIILTTKGSSYRGQSHQYGAKQKHLALPLVYAN
jgi:hypothetical protein